MLFLRHGSQSEQTAKEILKPASLLSSRYSTYNTFSFFSFRHFRRVLKENLVPAPKKIENEAEKMDMSVAAEEMEVINVQHWRCLMLTL